MSTFDMNNATDVALKLDDVERKIKENKRKNKRPCRSDGASLSC